jgi:hypothetical protein
MLPPISCERRFRIRDLTLFVWRESRGRGVVVSELSSLYPATTVRLNHFNLSSSPTSSHHFRKWMLAEFVLSPSFTLRWENCSTNFCLHKSPKITSFWNQKNNRLSYSLRRFFYVIPSSVAELKVRILSLSPPHVRNTGIRYCWKVPYSGAFRLIDLQFI